MKHSIIHETLKLYWQHAWRYKSYVIGLLLSVPIATLTYRFLPQLVIASILDRMSKQDFVPGQIWQSFGWQLASYVGLMVLGGIFMWRLVILLIWKLEMNVTRDMYQRIFNHLMDQSAAFHANRFGGSLVSQTNKFTSAYVRLADTIVFQVTGLFVSFLFTIVILAPRAPLVVVLLVVFSVIFMIVATRITRYIRTLNAREAAAQNKQTGFLADAITNVLAVKSFARGNYEKQRFAVATEEVRTATRHTMRASLVRELFFSGSTTTISSIALGLAVVSVVMFNAAIDTVYLVVSYTGIITENLWQFSQSTLRNINRSLGDAQEMTETLLIKADINDPGQPEKLRIIRGGVRFENVSFAYRDGQSAGTVLFDGLNLSIKPGEKIGLVGHSGGGKTTVTKLLLRYMDIQSGVIKIDQQDITRVTQDDLRQRIAYVPQEPLLFHRTLSENIAYGRPDASQAEIEATARMAHAHEFIEKLPKGYDTLVGERGVKLSGGQRQRIAIARAMLKNAPILVLDEATSALDSESEQLIQEALWKLMEGRTAIVIAHRLSTIQRMDRVIVLHEGKVVEEGSHKELIRQEGIYASLWSRQSGGFLEE